MLNFFFCVCSFLSIGIIKGSYPLRTGWAQKTNYPKFCQQAASNDEVFNKFRSNIEFVDIVETMSYQMGLEFEKAIVALYPGLLPLCSKICAGDKVGGPAQRRFEKIGVCSPTTLRYIKVAGDLIREFGDLKDFTIVEIGGGYGGQAKILSDITPFKKYVIVDIPECKQLIRKFLSHFDVNTIDVMSNADLNHAVSADLVVSNYAFSEIDRNEQAHYIKHVVAAAPRGYMIYNLFAKMNPFAVDEFVNILKQNGRQVRVEREYPLTGEHNVLIIWKS